MDKREAAIVAAYTGIMIGKFSDMHAYIEEKIGPVFVHEIPSRREEIEQAAKQDFIALSDGVGDE